MKGRMYMAVPGAEGTQSSSSLMTAFSAAMNRSPGTSGMLMRSQVRAMRLIFMSGRKIWMWPSGVRYAFMPSNII